MRNVAIFFSMLVILMATAASTQASVTLKVGDIIYFSDEEGSVNGGEFGLWQSEVELFRTFCIETNEYIDYNQAGFVIDSISTDAVEGGSGGPDPDPISKETAWLFYQFARGVLSGYDYTPDSAEHIADANAVQKAIWYFEEENNGENNAFAQAATAAVAAGGSVVDAAVANVRVINPVWATTRNGFQEGQNAQSVLMVIPEPTTVLVWAGLGLIGLLAYRRLRLA